MSGLHITLAAEELFSVWGLPVTNTLLTVWVVIALLLLAGYLVGRRVRLIPGKVQNAFEMLFEFVFNYIEETLGSRALAERFFPLIVTLFLFIFAANLFEFLPFVESIGIRHGEEFIPLLRSANTDLNVTLALALIVFLTIEITGVVVLGFLKYWSKFVNLKGGVLGFLIGLIEFVSNLARLISFSFRLFGNIFAGEVLLIITGFLVPYVVPVPFLMLELFVGFVQALVFAMLTTVFLGIATASEHG